MRFNRVLLGLLVGLSVTHLSSARPLDAADGEKTTKAPVTSLPRISPALHDALAGREFARALQLIDAELKQNDTASPDYLLYLRGRAETELRQFAGALLTFQTLPRRYPRSVWVPRSRFGQADVYARQRDYQKAGEIYHAEAKRLLSRGRKDRLVEIYLEFAHRHFDGIPVTEPASEKPTLPPRPDYKQALAYYQQALLLEPSPAIRHTVEPRIGRCYHELGKHSAAIAVYRKYLKQYAADNVAAAKRAPQKLESDVRFQLGRAQLSAGQHAEARKTWQDFLASFAAKVNGGELVAVATFQISRTYGIPEPSTVGDMELGIAALERFLKAFPQHKLAPRADYDIAQS